MSERDLSFTKALNAHIFHNGSQPVPNKDNIREAQLAYAAFSIEDFTEITPRERLIEVVTRWQSYGRYLDNLIMPPIDKLTSEIRTVREEDVKRGLRTREGKISKAKAEPIANLNTIDLERSSF